MATVLYQRRCQMKGLVFKDLLLMKKMNKKVIFVMYFL